MVSITFNNPEYLWFLLTLPLLVASHFFLIRHAKHKAMKFANFAVLKRATGKRLITKNYTILAIRIVVITCAVLAVSQTVLWYEGHTNQNEFVIAIDTSSSMTAQDMQPSRLEVAKQQAAGFVDNLDTHTHVGLVSFSGVTFVEQPPTRDKGDLLSSLEEVEVTASGTDIPGAIITSTNLLVRAEKGRAMILITDGSNTIESFQSRSIQRATEYAKLNRVKIYTIGIGTDMQAPIGYLPTLYNISAAYNSENLESIANATGGVHYNAADAQEVAAAYVEITAADKTSRLSLDLTGGLMLIALMFIMIEWGLINTRFRSLP